MNYLISKFACVMRGEQDYTIYPECKYSISATDNTPHLVCDHNGGVYIFDMQASDNVVTFEYNRDQYFILKKRNNTFFSTIIRFKNSFVNISLGTGLAITYDGEVIVERHISDIHYSHFEIRKDYLIIYFKGAREYVVIMRDRDLKIASYYDEINILDGELIFMCRCYDSVEHGKVFLLNKNNEYDSYLIYLNNREIVDDAFVTFAMVDSILVGNTKFANNLLAEDIRLDDAAGIVGFFPDFDDYVCVESNTLALLEKNTLAGIYKFEIKDNYIVNIIQMN